MVQISTDAEALKPIIENSSDSQLSSADRLDQQTAIALDEVDKLATTAATNAAGGLDGAFARGATEIAPNKIARTETGQTKQIERLMQDTTTRVDRVLKRSADSYITTLPTAGTGNLERLLWANRADQVKNKITAVSASANESALVAEGFDAFYGEARNRAEQELSDQMAKFSDFQEKYNDSAWTRFRPTGAKRRQAARFEKFQAPMQEALQKRLDEMQSRIDGIKEGPQAQRVTNMSQKIDRRFKHAGADKKIKLWDQIQNATSYSGTITGLDLSEFGLANEDEKLLFIEALINGDLDWVKERLGLKHDSDTKFENQKAVIDSARTQETLVRDSLSLPSPETLKSILASSYLTDKEPLKEKINTKDLVSAIENDFRNNNATKDLIDTWFGTNVNRYDLLTDATKLHVFIKELQNSNWDLVQSLSLQTQSKLITWLHQIEEERGGNIEGYENEKVSAANNALVNLKGGLVTSVDAAGNLVHSAIPLTPENSVLGRIKATSKQIQDFDLSGSAANLNTLINDIETLSSSVEKAYQQEFVSPCQDEIDDADFRVLKEAWDKARQSVKTLKAKSELWQQDKEKHKHWSKNSKQTGTASEVVKYAAEIGKLEGNSTGSIDEAIANAQTFPYDTLTDKQAIAQQKTFESSINQMQQWLNDLRSQRDGLLEKDEPTLTGLEEIRNNLSDINDEFIVKHENKLKKPKNPAARDFESQLLEKLSTEFADQMEKTFLSKLAENDQYESLQKLGRGGRVKVHYKKIGATSNMRFPDQLDTPDIVEFKVNRVIDGKIELVQDVAPAHGSRLVMVVTGSPFNASDSDLVARAGVSEQPILTTHPTVTYGPTVNPEAAIITNMNVL